mmetsp:Transcript_18898/g.42089  ORF Transcript_18898/g.42089 Transcript_18898/m.42089 type:complete len:397 (+) Transcript_18898:700-1890(+)
MTHSERQADVLRRIEGALLPMSYPMLDWARKGYWLRASWDTDKGRSRRITYLTTCLLMDTGNRISCASGPTHDAVLGVTTDHGVKTAQVEISVRKPSDKTSFSLAGAAALRTYLCNPKAVAGATDALRYPRVQSLRITFLTQKVVRDGKGTPDPLFYGRRDPRESQFVDDVCDWLRFNPKLLDSDYLTTRYQLAPKPNAKTDKRLLQRQDVADLIKASAVAFDLPPHRFSTSSCRRFAGSTDALTMPEVKVRGGWAAGSTVTEQNYRRNPEGRGAFAVAGDGGEFTHQQLEGLTRKPLAACPSLSSDEDVADDDRYDMGVEDEWDCGTGTGESEGVEGLLQDLLGPERGAALDGGLPSEPRVVVPCVVDGPPVGVGKKRKLPAGLARNLSTQRTLR